MKKSRRRFLSKCLVVPAVLGAAAIRPKIESGSDFAPPKFSFGQQVEYRLEDFDGETLIERGRIIGMLYEASEDRPDPEWSYLIQWIACHNLKDSRSWVVGDDPTFLSGDDLTAVT